MYCWYLRHTYLQNELKVPGALTVCGEKVDLGKIKAPVFVYGSREDHIVPWAAAYGSVPLFKGKRVAVIGGGNSGVEAAIDRAKGENPRAYKEWRQEVLDMLVDGVLPVPTAVKTAFELSLNRSTFFRKPIVSRALEGVEPRYQANPSTSQLARKAGDLLNVSPAKIEYGVGAIGGTLGREALRAGDTFLGTGKASGPSPRLGDLPLVGRAFARTPDMSNDSTETFYDELGEVRKAVSTMKLLRKQDPEEARRRTPEYRRALLAERVYEATAERLSNLRKEIERTNKAPDSRFSREEKRRRVDALAVRMTELARRVVDRRMLEEKR